MDEKPKKKTYSASQKKAIYNYREKNKEKYNTYQRDYHKKRMKTDEEYRARKEQDCANSNRNKKAKEDAKKEAMISIVPEPKEVPKLENIIINVDL